MNALPARIAGVGRAGDVRAGAGWRAAPPGAGRGRGSPGSTRSTASAAPRRSRRWPTAPRRSAAVDKIVGPGNAYVAEAKRQVFGRVGIDLIAGPSEILVVADGDQDPDWIAADLLSQAEHDELAQAILITDSAALADRVAAAVEAQLADLPRRGDRRGRAGATSARSSGSRDLDGGAGAGRPAGARASRAARRRAPRRWPGASAMPARSSSAPIRPR